MSDDERAARVGGNDHVVTAIVPLYGMIQTNAGPGANYASAFVNGSLPGNGLPAKARDAPSLRLPVLVISFAARTRRACASRATLRLMQM